MAIITRADSGLGPHRAGVMATPVPDLFGHHSVTPFWVGAQAALRLQQIARARGFLDISYSWLGDRAGNEIEGRGWGRAGAHTQGFNTRSHALCFVGNLESTPMPDGMIRAAVRICRRAARYGPGRITRPHSAVSQTACPGQHGRAAIPAINAAASGTPTPPQEDDMSPEQERRFNIMYDRILRIERGITPKGDTLGSYRDSEVPDDRRLGHMVARLDERLNDKTVRWIYQRLQRIEQALTSSESGSLGTYGDIEEERTLRAQLLSELGEIKAALADDGA